MPSHMDPGKPGKDPQAIYTCKLSHMLLKFHKDLDIRAKREGGRGVFNCTRVPRTLHRMVLADRIKAKAGEGCQTIRQAGEDTGLLTNPAGRGRLLTKPTWSNQTAKKPQLVQISDQDSSQTENNLAVSIGTDQRRCQGKRQVA
ncbi:hypothetical protein CDL15_Pgr015623 [Punica granatum]|uniref:Uncharacterized protein n=1 Tax=Punica granatum TaxID=22663 RepID=A0A218XP76_PUNGR|nr:hypothetical protein CDL15_Pgr015623 [Punica granatum]